MNTYIQTNKPIQAFRILFRNPDFLFCPFLQLSYMCFGMCDAELNSFDEFSYWYCKTVGPSLLTNLVLHKKLGNAAKHITHS